MTLCRTGNDSEYKSNEWMKVRHQGPRPCYEWENDHTVVVYTRLTSHSYFRQRGNEIFYTLSAEMLLDHCRPEEKTRYVVLTTLENKNNNWTRHLYFNVTRLDPFYGGCSHQGVSMCIPYTTLPRNSAPIAIFLLAEKELHTCSCFSGKFLSLRQSYEYCGILHGDSVQLCVE